eukprot:scaffold173911_cov69-Cyclotella_meneghiniana.AAC.1
MVRSAVRAGHPTAVTSCPTVSVIPSSTVGAFRTMTILSKESGEEFKKQNYSSRMAKTSRPVSPHVTIYSFPIAALTSITTRVTGCALSFGCAGLGVVEIFGGSGAALSLMQDIGGSGALLAAGAKFSVAFPLVYHYLGGLRHFVWDNKPDLLTNVDVEKASYGLVGGSVVISTIAMVL